MSQNDKTQTERYAEALEAAKLPELDADGLKKRYANIERPQLLARLYSAEKRIARIDGSINFWNEELEATTKDYETKRDAAKVEGLDDDEQSKRDKAVKTASSAKARPSVFLKLLRLMPFERRAASTTRGKNAADIHAELQGVIKRLEELDAKPESVLTMEDMKFLWKEGPAKRTQLRGRYKTLTGRTWTPEATDHTHEGEGLTDNGNAEHELEAVGK